MLTYIHLDLFRSHPSKCSTDTMWPVEIYIINVKVKGHMNINELLIITITGFSQLITGETLFFKVILSGHI